MSFFKFITDLPGYSKDSNDMLRLNRRHTMLVAPYQAELDGARVLDLGAHDGRWAYALAAAGAREVVGIEARDHLIARFDAFPDATFKARVKLVQGDLFEVLQAYIDAGERFDIISVFGIYYHIMDHLRLLLMIRQLGARLVLVDSEFSLGKGANITLVTEDTGKDLNAAPQRPGQPRALVGIPTFAAMEKLAQAAGYALEWGDAHTRFGSDTTGLQDYFRAENKRRAFCALRAPDA